jgi:uncharacterized caspase-like protein
MFLRMLLLAGVIASAILPASAKAERRVALVIGNAQYANASVLRNPRNDAADMAATLKKLGFEVLVGLDLDQQKFARAVESFARLLDGADVGLLFYAGHGVQINEKNYLVSTNAALKSEFLVSAEALELDAVIRLMESKVPTNLVFLDACRNNPLADELKTSLASLKRSVAVGRGLARIEPTGRDTLVAFAAAPGQEAIDGRDRNSPFTAALLKHMPKAGLEVSVMLKEVAADVRRDTNNAQRPQQLSDMSRKFFFADAQAAEAPVPPPAPIVESAPVVPAAAAAAAAANTDNRALDLAFWNAAQTSNECEAVRAYLTRFPNGVFVELAKLQERRLCTPARRIEVVEAAPQAAPAVVPAPAVKAAAVDKPAAVKTRKKEAVRVAVATRNAKPRRETRKERVRTVTRVVERPVERVVMRPQPIMGGGLGLMIGGFGGGFRFR